MDEIVHLKKQLEEEKRVTDSLKKELINKTSEIELLKHNREQINHENNLTQKGASKQLESKYSLLDKIINEIFDKVDIYDISWAIANILAEYLGTNDCVIYAVAKSKKHVEQIATSFEKISIEGEIINRLTIPIGSGIVGTVAKTGISEIIHDTSKDARYIKDISNRYSEITIPVLLNGEVIGVIDSEHPDKNFFSNEQLKTIEDISKFIALKLNNALNLRDRVKFEKQLLLSQTRLSSLISSLEYGLLLEDENRRIVLTNSKFCKLFQIPMNPMDLIGQDCSNAASQSKHLFNNPELFIENINVILKNRVKVLSDELVMVDGTILERDYIPIYNNSEYLGHLWSYRDVTLQRNYRLSLEAQKQKYSDIITNMNLGLLEVNLKDEILMANKSFFNISGYLENELIGKKAGDLFLTKKEKIKLDAESKKRLKGISGLYEIKIKNKQGNIRYWLVSGAPNYDLNGKIVGSIGVHLDITEQRKLQKQKEKLLHELKKSNEELEQYAHIVSHDLKSPLNNISALTTWIKTDNYDKLNPHSLEHFNHLDRTLEKMELLISGILKYASISKNTINFKEQDLNLLVNDLIVTSNTPDHITIKVLKKLPKINGDYLKLVQLFQNLIDNAIKFIDKDKGLIEIDFQDNNTHYKFSIKDNGIGIEKEFHKKVFQIFQTINSNKNSTGIGLSIVKKIIDVHQGEIWLDSEYGKGTTIYFTLKKQI